MSGAGSGFVGVGSGVQGWGDQDAGLSALDGCLVFVKAAVSGCQASGRGSGMMHGVRVKCRCWPGSCTQPVLGLAHRVLGGDVALGDALARGGVGSQGGMVTFCWRRSRCQSGILVPECDACTFWHRPAQTDDQVVQSHTSALPALVRHGLRGSFETCHACPFVSGGGAAPRAALPHSPAAMPSGGRLSPTAPVSPQSPSTRWCAAPASFHPCSCHTRCGDLPPNRGLLGSMHGSLPVQCSQCPGGAAPGNLRSEQRRPETG